MTANKVVSGLLFDQNWPGSSVTVDVGPVGSTGCLVKITRPSGWIGLVGTLGNAWKVEPNPGSGLQSATIGKVYLPNCTAPGAVSNVEANRPSCSASLLVNGVAASTAGIDFTFTKNPVLTVTKPGLGSGTVSSTIINQVQGINCGTNCLQQYPVDTKVTLTAVASLGSTFDGWVNAPGCLGLTSCEVTMSQDRSVSAVFVQDGKTQISAELYGHGHGTVVSSPAGVDCPGTCSSAFFLGAPVTLTATPDSDSLFVKWLGDCSGTTTTCNVTMDSNQSVGAVFSLKPVPTDLSVTKNGTGAGSVASAPAGIDCGTTCTHAFDSGTTVDLTAAADAGSTFSGWSGPCSGTGSCSIELNSAVEVFATFALKAYQPDGRVAVGSGAVAGDGVYNKTGKGQTKSAKAARGKSVMFTWSVQNDGNAADTVKLKQSANSLGGFNVKYFVGKTNVTKKIKAGEYSKQLPVAASVTVKVKATVLTSADLQSTKKLLLTATSTKDGTKKDAVRVNITAVR
ncbi:MAG: hypothetical protein LH645_08235 [Actinomycetia bacterium]|nr:hypothetical protein [Actinomycetes bacterium]